MPLDHVLLRLLLVCWTLPFRSEVLQASGESNLRLDRLLDKEVRRFKVEYHRILETERVRRKRDAGLMLSMSIQQDSPREHRKIAPVAEVEFVAPLSNFRVNCWAWIQPDPATPAVLLLLVTDEQLILVANHGQEFKIIQNLDIEDRAYRAQVFVNGPYVWFALVQQSRQDGRHYIQMYRCNGVEVQLKQTIPLESQADLALVYNRGYWYMATATQNRLTLFEWRQTQFDEVASTPVFGLRSVTIWRSAGVIYIATAVTTGRAGSPLFSYSRRNGGKLSRLQVLPVHSASKVVKFTVDGNNYLLFVCKDFVAIYWGAGNVFLEYQVLQDTAGALDAAVLLLPNGEAAIAILFKNEIRFYVEGFSSEYYLTFSRSVLVDLSPGFGFFYHSNMHYFLFLTFDLANWDSKLRALDEKLPDNIWRLNVTNYYDLQKEMDPLSSCIDSMKRNLEANSQNLNYIEANLDKVLVTNKEQKIDVPVFVFGEVDVTEGLNVEHLILIPSRELPVVPQVTSGVLRDSLLAQEHELNNLLPGMDNFLYKSQNQIINGDLIFLSPLKATKLQLPSLVNDVSLNSVPLSVLSENTLQTHGVQTLMYNLQATHIESQSLILEGHINGVFLHDVILLHQDEIIESELHFTNIRVQDINLNEKGTINGIEPSTFVIKNQPQVIGGVKTFHNLVVQKDIVVHGQTNQHDLSVFVQNILRFDQPDSLQLENVEFSAPLIVEGDVYIEGLINGIVDLKDLATKTLDLSTNQVIKGKQTFSAPVFVNGDVSVEGTTNGIDISEQVLTLSTDQYVPGMTVFDSFEVFGDLSTGTVNGYDLRKEVVTVQGPPQSIGGHKTFKQPVRVMLDVDMKNGSTLNELDLSMLVQTAARMDNVVFLGPTTFHSLVIEEIIASDSINGIALDHLFNYVWRKSTNQDISVPVQFLQSIVVDNDLEVTNSVNGYDLTEDFVHTYGDEEISGYVRFIEDVHILDGLHMAPRRTINGFDVSDYNRSMVPSQQDTLIHSKVVFSSVEVRGNLIIDGTVDGTRLDNLLQADKNQVFTGHVTLSDHTTVSGNLALDSLFLERDINGVDFSEFNKHVVYDYDTSPGELPIVEKKDFVGGLEVDRLDSRGTVNGINMDEWYLKAVRLSTNDEISGFKRFSAVELLGGFSSEALNDVPLSDHLSSVVMTTTDHIRGPKTVDGSVFVNGNLVTKGPVNGVNLLLLDSEAIYADSNNVFAGPVVVGGNLVVENLALGELATLDGIPWNQLVFLDQNHALQGVTTFKDEVAASEATVKHTVSGCDIRRLAEEAIYLGQPFPTLSQPLTVRSLIVHGNVNTPGRISGVDLKSLAEGVLRKSGQQKITGQVQFTNLQAENTHFYLVNGLNLTALIGDAVLKSQPQTIFGRKHFMHVEGVTVSNDLHIVGNMEVDGHVCGVDLSDLQTSVVFKTSEQNIAGLKTFKEVEVQGDVYIQGLINAVSVPSEVILLEKEEEIKAPLVLRGDSRVIGNLYVGQHLDGVQLQQFIDNRVTLIHDQEISAYIEFQDTLQTDLLNVLGSVNGVSITDIVLQRGGAQLSDQKIFENSITIQGNLVVHQLNGVDLLEFDRELVRINKPQEISTLIEFVTELDVQNDLLIEHSINDINVKGLEQEFADYHHGLATQLQFLHEQINSLNIQVHHNQEQLHSRQFWDLLHFQPFQSLDVLLTRLFPSPLQNVIILEEDKPAGQVQKLLGWSSSCEPRGCCGASATHVFEVDSLGSLKQQNVESGRLFPLFTEAPLADNNLHGFVLWTNTTPHSQICPVHQLQSMSIVSIENGDGLSNVIEHIHPIFTPIVQDARLFKFLGHLHLLITYAFNQHAGNATRPSVFRYSNISSSWFLLQPLGGDRTTSMDLGLYTDTQGQRHLLAALTDELTLYVYGWTDTQFSLLTSISAPSVTTSTWVEAGGSLYLMLSMSHLLSVYMYMPDPVEGSHLPWVQNLELTGITVLKAFQFSGESFVVAASQTVQELIVLQWRGSEGFVPVQRHPVSGVRDVAFYWSPSGDLLLAVASDCGTLILKAVAIGFGQRH